VTQDRIWSERKHRRHPPTAAAQAWVPDRVDPTMHVMEVPSPHPAIDSLFAKSSLENLPPGDNTVLPRRYRRNGFVGQGAFPFHMAGQSAPPPGSLPPANLIF
jgi:hypothetical protein